MSSKININEQITIVERSTLSIDENELSSILIYPNPVKNRLIINSDVIVKTVTLFNTLGQNVLEVYPDNAHVSIDIQLWVSLYGYLYALTFL